MSLWFYYPANCKLMQFESFRVGASSTCLLAPLHDRDFFFWRAEWLWSFCRFAIWNVWGRCGPQYLAERLEHLRKPLRRPQAGSTSCFRRLQREFPVRKKPPPPILEHVWQAFEAGFWRWTLLFGWFSSSPSRAGAARGAVAPQDLLGRSYIFSW